MGSVARVAMMVGLMAGMFSALASTQGITNTDILDGLANGARWLTHSGDYTGQRHSPLTQITPANVGQLAAQWTFQTGVLGKFEATPIVIDGTLYVTGADNNAWAIDGKTGRQLWRYLRTLPPQGLRVCCGRVNRGFAVLGDQLFMSTLDAHLVSLDRTTGKVLWDIAIADYTQGYASTGAPLVVNDKLIIGIAGGEFAVRGFLDAYDVKTGERKWRFWTIPAPGEKGSETWPDDVWERGGGPTWQIGSYDPQLNMVYWGTGNPNPDLNGANRRGDNLYTGSLVALDADTGTLKWHFQFTPHDEHDWDSNHIPVLADLTISGAPRKVVMVANRNGFFYVLDRTNGQFILGKPYMKLTWASGLDSKGRPMEIENQRPTPTGTLTCPELFGGTNFNPPSFSPLTGLFYVSVRETCAIYISSDPPPGYKSGDLVMGGTLRRPDQGTGALRAIDPLTGDWKWELKHPTPPWAGVLSTASGIVFSGTNEGHAIAADAKTGAELWRYPTGSSIYAPPTTYLVDGRQYVVIPSGTTLTAFALPSNR
jgi:alcohol dehydrogenase (cytochrome c)